MDPVIVESTFARLRLPTPSTFPYTALATCTPLSSSPSDDISMFSLVFQQQYREGLRDIDGFSHSWLVFMNTDPTLSEQLSSDHSLSSGAQLACADGDSSMFLLLVDVHSVTPTKGEIIISTDKKYHQILSSPHTLILDFKVYLPYVEAHPETST